MRILVLGCSGLIGHKIYIKLSEKFGEVYGIMAKEKSFYSTFEYLNNSRIIEKVNVLEQQKFEGILHAVNPDVVLNCIGITKRKIDSALPYLPILTNAVFPHYLAHWAKTAKKRIIHFSTDCVFNGETGNYDENSLTTGEDIYGKSKALGEIIYKHSLTIRSSFIGREISDFTELLEWFLSQKGKKIKGYTNALYTGISTTYLSNVVCEIIQNYPDLNGLYNLSVPIPVSKYELLCIARESFNLDVEIIPDPSLSVKPTLNGTKLRQIMHLTVPSWKEMMDELAKETYYNCIKK